MTNRPALLAKAAALIAPLNARVVRLRIAEIIDRIAYMAVSEALR